MKVLLVKMSSLGDVLHTLPAVYDLYRTKNIKVDWVVEPAFAPLIQGHPGVDKVISMPIRQMRQSFLSSLSSGLMSKSVKTLRGQSYDRIIDAQGLLKSALVCQLAKGKRFGLDKHSIREPLAARFYQQTFPVGWHLHAVQRVRSLFAQIFEYDEQALPFDYGLQMEASSTVEVPADSILFLHGTTWATKHWPLKYWQHLAQQVSSKGLRVLLPYGNDTELQRAKLIVQSVSSNPKPIILPSMSLLELAQVLLQVTGVVAVDTGLGHLASALSVPCVSVYGPTDPKRTGTYGHNQVHFQTSQSCAPCLKRRCQLKGPFAIHPPCFESVTPRQVWAHLEPLLVSPVVRQQAC